MSERERAFREAIDGVYGFADAVILIASVSDEHGQSSLIVHELGPTHTRMGMVEEFTETWGGEDEPETAADEPGEDAEDSEEA